MTILQLDGLDLINKTGASLFSPAMRGWANDDEYPECGSDLPEIIVHYTPEFTDPLDNRTAKHFEEDLLNLTCGVVGNCRCATQ